MSVRRWNITARDIANELAACDVKLVASLPIIRSWLSSAPLMQTHVLPTFGEAQRC